MNRVNVSVLATTMALAFVACKPKAPDANQVKALEKNIQTQLENRDWSAATASISSLDAIYQQTQAPSAASLWLEKLKTVKAQHVHGLSKQLSTALAGRDLAAAEKLIGEIKSHAPDAAIVKHVETEFQAAKTSIEEAKKNEEAAKLKAAADTQQAKEIFQRISAMNPAVKDAAAITELEKALALVPNPESPERIEIQALLDKVQAKPVEIRVPGSFATAIEAFAAAKAGDVVILGEQEFDGPIVVRVPVTLQGVGSSKTIVSCEGDKGAVITFAPEAAGTTVKGIHFKHDTASAAGTERFSLALVQGSKVTFDACEFTSGNGHGLAVISGGAAMVTNCQMIQNGWDGAVAIGIGSTLQISDSKLNNNMEHGLETFDGATLSATRNTCEHNTRNGIHIDSAATACEVQENRMLDNKEFGLVLTNASKGSVSKNTAERNGLGGYAIRSAAKGVMVTSNIANDHSNFGFYLETGLQTKDFLTNQGAGNKAGDLSPNNNFNQVAAADQKKSAPSAKKSATSKNKAKK